MKKQRNFNTKKITNADNSFEKDFFKLIFNSVYGKTMEKLQKTINVRLVNNKKVFLKYTSRPTHITHKNFGKNYAAIHEIKPVLTLNKPIYIEIAVPELRKWLMYDFVITYLTLNCYLLTQIVLLMNNLLSTNICLTLVTIQKIQRFLIRPIRKLLVK